MREKREIGGRVCFPESGQRRLRELALPLVLLLFLSSIYPFKSFLFTTLPRVHLPTSRLSFGFSWFGDNI